jgi:hypothetical protein
LSDFNDKIKFLGVIETLHWRDDVYLSGVLDSKNLLIEI